MLFVNKKASGKEVARTFARRAMVVALTVASFAVSTAALASSAPYPDAAQKAEIDRLIVFYSKKYNVPVALSRKVVESESEYRPLARNGPYWGLMQIRYDTAKGMGFEGQPTGLLDAETNLAFGIAYLSNALKAAQGNTSRGHMLYRTGYYFEARRKRVLDEMIAVRDFKPVGGSPTLMAMAEMPEGTGDLWSGEAPPATNASAAITAAMAAPMPRSKPVATMSLAAADAGSEKQLGAKTADGKTAPAIRTASTLAPLPLAAPVGAKATAGPAVAQPTVVYASVLPLSRPIPLAKPALPVVASGVVPDEPAAVAEADTGVAASDVPMPRPKPVVAAVEPAEPPPSPLQLALNAAAARKSAELAAANPQKAVPVAAATPELRRSLDAGAPAARPLVVASHVAVPLPRARPIASE